MRLDEVLQVDFNCRANDLSRFCCVRQYCQMELCLALKLKWSLSFAYNFDAATCKRVMLLLLKPILCGLRPVRVVASCGCSDSP